MEGWEVDGLTSNRRSRPCKVGHMHHRRKREAGTGELARYCTAPSEFHMSTQTFQDPSACFRHTWKSRTSSVPG
jgi:hypothetical protein